MPLLVMVHTRSQNYTWPSQTTGARLADRDFNPARHADRCLDMTKPPRLTAVCGGFRSFPDLQTTLAGWLAIFFNPPSLFPAYMTRASPDPATDNSRQAIVYITRDTSQNWS